MTRVWRFNERGDNLARLEDIGDARIAAMDEQGIAMHIISLAPPATGPLAPAKAVALSRETNDIAAEAVHRHPSRRAEGVGLHPLERLHRELRHVQPGAAPPRPRGHYERPAAVLDGLSLPTTDPGRASAVPERIRPPTKTATSSAATTPVASSVSTSHGPSFLSARTRRPRAREKSSGERGRSLCCPPVPDGTRGRAGGPRSPGARLSSLRPDFSRTLRAVRPLGRKPLSPCYPVNNRLSSTTTCWARPRGRRLRTVPRLR